MNNHVHFKTVNLPIVVLTLFKPFSCYSVNKLSFKEKLKFILLQTRISGSTAKCTLLTQRLRKIV